MILYIQLILIFVLILTLILLYIEDRRYKRARIPVGRLTQLWNGDERRRHVRINANIPVRYSLIHNPEKLTNIKVKDISNGGMCLILNEKLNKYTILNLEIGFPDSFIPLFAKGSVVWIEEQAGQENPSGIRRFDTGIEFVEMSPRDRQRLLGFIKGVEWIRDGRGQIEG